MELGEYRAVFLIATAILSLFVASPALSRLLIYPRTEFFTEFWILDANHRAEDYPYNISRNQNYSLFLGIANRLGYCAYYVLEAKFRNQNQSAPSSLNRTPSQLLPLFNVTAFVADEQTWELPLVFSLNYESNETLLQARVDSLTLNDVTLTFDGQIASWNPTKKEFLGNLFFEAWIYNNTNSRFQYHERFVSLRFNMTS